ncbi:hypothetical protein ACFVYJ_09460 [Pontibacter sp. JAM-7]|uniref:hypothetical protein n=1 Tax=Pontibacter sp. JAM-7 TaxID=3366581 RepID=UPI003AF71F3A
MPFSVQLLSNQEQVVPSGQGLAAGNDEFLQHLKLFAADVNLQNTHKINHSEQVLLAAQANKQALIRDFLDYLMRHGLTETAEHNTSDEDYLVQPFRVKGSSGAETKMDALLDQAAVLRQLFAVIAEQRAAAKAGLEAHWEEQRAAEPDRLAQPQLDDWELWLRQQLLILPQ